MKTNAEVAANLRRAKEILQTSGRGVGALYNSETGCYCLLGAVGVAVGGYKFQRLLDELEDAYGEFCFSGAAVPEVRALAETLGVDYRSWLRERGGTFIGDYTDVYEFNDRFAGHHSDGDEKVFNLIDRAVASLEAA